MSIESTVAAQRAYFAKEETLDVAFRKDALRRLRETILSREAQINAALAQDLGKSPSESYMCEVGMTLSELSYTLSHVDRWARRHPVLTPLAQFHARSFTVHNP
ncbi:MAG: aldehyde dehydrogenase family protein, partial [Candidatus Ventricola sp.]